MELTSFREAVTRGQLDLRVLNSLTKYPSIPTYHGLDKRTGDLVEDERVAFTGDVVLTEKIDGTNARIIVAPGGADWIVGSREELLAAEGDLIPNPKLGIVAAVRDAARLATERLIPGTRTITVLYGEVYGHGVGKNARDYVGDERRTGFRLFDVQALSVAHLAKTPEEAAAWRDGGGQVFASERTIASFAGRVGVERVPVISTAPVAELPATLDEAHNWLGWHVDRTRAALVAGARERAEGIVLRGFAPDGHRQLAKVRYEDYDRTFRRREAQRPKPRREGHASRGDR